MSMENVKKVMEILERYPDQISMNELVVRLDSERDEALAEIDGLQATLIKQGSILTGVANALKGPPDELTAHSHHDLADVAVEFRDAIIQAEEYLSSMGYHFPDETQDHGVKHIMHYHEMCGNWLRKALNKATGAGLEQGE